MWQGGLVAPDVAGLVMAVAHLGGAGDLSALMGPPHATLEIKGTVRLCMHAPAYLSAHLYVRAVRLLS